MNACSNPVFGGYWIARSSRAMTVLRLLRGRGGPRQNEVWRWSGVGQRRCHTPLPVIARFKRAIQYPRAIVKNECLLQSRIRWLLDRPHTPGHVSRGLFVERRWDPPEQGVAV